jgi:hypothetical protein
MVVEPLIFGGDYGLQEIGRNLLQGNDGRVFLVAGEQGAQGAIVAIAKFHRLIDLGQIPQLDWHQIRHTANSQHEQQQYYPRPDPPATVPPPTAELG